MFDCLYIFSMKPFMPVDFVISEVLGL